MASTYPTSLDNFTNPTVSDYLNSTTVPHATQHSDLNDAVENLQAKVGIDSSADTGSIDYKVTDAASRITTLEAGATADAIVAYADLAARTAANPSPSEGDVSWQEDTNRFDIYNGSAWSQVAVGGTFTDYTASASGGVGLTVGNGTWDFAGYVQVGNLVIYQIEFTLGSTSAISGNIAIGLPITSKLYSTTTYYGVGTLCDTGVATYPAVCRSINQTAFTIHPQNASGTYLVQSSASATVPFTWTTGDRITATVIYAAA